MGNFVHIELNTPNSKKAKSFYAKVFGWKLADMPMPDGVYTMAEGMMNPGIGMQKSPIPNLPPHWLPYIEVKDVKKAVAAAKKAGAQVPVPFFDVPGMGSGAWLVDPTGAPVAIWQNKQAPAKKKATKRKAKKKTTKRKATKKKTTKKKATKKKATKKKATKKKATKKKATKKKATKKKPARRAKKKTARKR